MTAEWSVWSCQPRPTQWTTKCSALSEADDDDNHDNDNDDPDNGGGGGDGGALFNIMILVTSDLSPGHPDPDCKVLNQVGSALW